MLIDAQAMTGTSVITSEPMYLETETKMFSIFAQWTGTPNGSLKLQVTSKHPQSPRNGVPVDLSAAADWTDLPDSTLAIAGAAGNQLYNVVQASYFWVRVVYTNTSSTGVLSVWAAEKN